MNIITELEGHGSLFNKETLKDILKPLTSREGLSDSFLEEQRTFYYTKNSRSLKEYSFHHSDEVAFKVVKFTNTRNFFTHPWCFGFLKVTTPEGYVWQGAYAGKHGELFTKMKKVVRSPKGSRTLLSKVTFPRAITLSDVFQKFDTTELSNQVYEKLADTDEWDSLQGVKGLQTYLKTLTYVARDKALFAENLSEELVLIPKDSGYTLLFNSGLLDKYLNFIVLKAELEESNISFLREPYYTVKKLSTTVSLSDYGLEDSLPVMQLCTKSQLIFPSEKIHLVDTQSIDHIFKDRSNRLCSRLKECSSEVLYDSLKYSVNLALKKSKVDTQYLVPFLNMKWGKVSYLMPFYVKHIDNDNPLCAVVIGEVNTNIWAPVTILKLETARSNARLLGKLNASWLTTLKGGMVNEDCES